MLIIEGPDNSGKSSLAKKLSLEFNLKIIKSSGPPTGENDLVRRIKSSLEYTKLGINFIYDRYSLISEYVYGPTLRKINLLDNEEGHKLWKEFIETKPLIIYCRPPYANIIKYGKRRQMRGVRKEADSLILAYDNLMDRIKSSVDIFSYNYMDKADWEVYIKVREYLKGDKID